MILRIIRYERNARPSLHFLSVSWIFLKCVKDVADLLPTDRKATDPSQAGDQTDSKVKDSKERWVFSNVNRSLWPQSVFGISFCLNHGAALFSVRYLDFYRLHHDCLSHEEALVLTQWCTYADSETHTCAECLIHCHCHLSVKLPLKSI